MSPLTSLTPQSVMPMWHNTQTGAKVSGTVCAPSFARFFRAPPRGRLPGYGGPVSTPALPLRGLGRVRATGSPTDFLHVMQVASCGVSTTRPGGTTSQGRSPFRAPRFPGGECVTSAGGAGLLLRLRCISGEYREFGRSYGSMAPKPRLLFIL